MNILISGASSGIGRAASVHFARLGHTIWAGVRSQKSFDAVTRMNVQGLRPLFLDVTSSKSIADAVKQIRKTSGTLHALVNNAGIVVAGPIEALPIEQWRKQFDVNFFGVVELTAACLPSLRESKGRVINMSSISGRMAAPMLGPYSASKFALEALSDSLRREVASFGVKVVVIEPGPIKTEIWGKSRKDNLEQMDQLNAESREFYEQKINWLLAKVDESERGAIPIDRVLYYLEKALLLKQPNPRYVVGAAMTVAATLASVLPDNWMDRLIERDFKV